MQQEESMKNTESEKEEPSPEEKKVPEERISALEEELKEYKDKYLRLLAELENTRKRLQKEKNEQSRLAVENTICEFIPVIDNFEKALKFAENVPGEVKSWASGFQMFLTQLKDILHNHGIVAFHSEGNLFDPHLHEAVETEETQDHPEGMILQEFSKGYKSKARTIRAARVKVAKRASEPKEPYTENQEQEKE